MTRILYFLSGMILAVSLVSCGEISMEPTDDASLANVESMLNQLENGKSLEEQREAAKWLGQQKYPLNYKKGKETAARVLEALNKKLRYGGKGEAIVLAQSANSLCLMSAQIMEQKERLYDSGADDEVLGERIRRDLRLIFSDLSVFVEEKP